jgi:hypothetical protein
MQHFKIKRNVKPVLTQALKAQSGSSDTAQLMNLVDRWSQHTALTALPPRKYTGTHKTGDRVDLPESILTFWREKYFALTGIQNPYRSVRNLVTTPNTISLSIEFIYAFLINIDAQQSIRSISHRVYHLS